MLISLDDGYRCNVEEVGAGFPVIVLHGGGMDHTMFRPYLDSLGEEFRILYADQRGQGRSDRADPEGLSLDVFAADVDRLAEVLGLDAFALLGHSFGAFVTTKHAIEHGTATAYVISGGAEATDALLADVDESLVALGEAGSAIAASWDDEKTVQTDDELRQLLRVQMPFHFHGEPPAGYGEQTRGSADVVRHFARVGWGNFDFRPQLHAIRRPTLVIVGEHDRTTTLRAARVLHGSIPDSELVVIPAAGHMSFVEQPTEYIATVRQFLLDATGEKPTSDEDL
jgi:proline iminopeptidase